MIHALVKLWEHTQSSTPISQAEVLFDTIKAQDDTTCCGAHPGGVWWDAAHTEKATAAQIGVTVAALRLRETTHATEYSQSTWLSYATSHYSFWKSYFTNSGTGQVVDHEDTSGNLVWWGFTYNNGLMLGAAVHLYNATGSSAYLTDAALWASYLLNGQSVSINGVSKTILNNNCGGCDGDCSQFQQVAFQYLAEYYQLLYTNALSNPSSVTSAQLDSMCNIFNFLQNNIDSLWLNARNTTTGEFNCNWNSQFSTGTNGLQGSMNSAMSAFSQFASLPIFMTSP
jgi:hypothetical protein